MEKKDDEKVEKDDVVNDENNLKSEKEKDKESSGEASNFSELLARRSAHGNVSKLMTFFENKGKMDQEKVLKVTPKVRKRSWRRKIVPLGGQLTMYMFLVKLDDGKDTPKSAKRKIDGKLLTLILELLLHLR